MSASPNADHDLKHVSSRDKAEILAQALPYIRKFHGKTIVIKYGGNAMTDPALQQDFAEDVVLLKLVGMNPVVVHGGGPQIEEALAKLGKKGTFIQGMRVTDAETMEVVEWVLAGQVQQDIVGLINVAGGKAVGLSGKDGNLTRAEKYYLNEEKQKDMPTEIIDVGLVGKVKAINADLVLSLVRDGFIPVIAPTGMGDGGETYNINADIVAGEVAAALKAEKLVLLTDVEGVWDKDKQLINTMDNRRALEMIDDGTIAGGMFPKVKCCLKALRGGVGKAHIIDGRKKHAMLLEIFTDQGVGTEIIL